MNCGEQDGFWREGAGRLEISGGVGQKACRITMVKRPL